MWVFEYTDTFGGEANYSWVKRGDLNPAVAVKGEAAVKRAAKKAVGLNGVRGRWEDYGDMFRFTPYGACVTLFVHYDSSRWDGIDSVEYLGDDIHH